MKYAINLDSFGPYKLKVIMQKKQTRTKVWALGNKKYKYKKNSIIFLITFSLNIN